MHHMSKYLSGRTIGLVLSTTGILLSLPQTALAHGAITSPVSRIYQCYLEGPEHPVSDACKAAVAARGTSGLYNWNGVRQGNANGNHLAVVPDGQLCGGGDPVTFGGMDLARTDWRATEVAAGSKTFTWRNTAAHATSYYRYYITRNGYNPALPLKWSDLDLIKDTGPSAATTNATHTFNLPARSGKHVVYSVWQRSDSPEAFYACVDVNYGGSVTTTTSSSSTSSSGSTTSTTRLSTTSSTSTGATTTTTKATTTTTMTSSCTSPQYVNGASYATGAKVQNVGNEYTCLVGGWCTVGGPYAPGVGWAWTNTWSLGKKCS